MVFETDEDVATRELLWSEIGCLAEVETDAMQRCNRLKSGGSREGRA
jgi:hypothetical protein